MKKRFYFLSILILFLVNIGGVNGLTSWATYGTTQTANTFCFGSCPNDYQSGISYNANMSTWVGVPGANNTPVYADFYVGPSVIGEEEKEFNNAVLEYKFCSSWNDGFIFESIGTPPWSYSVIRKTSESCTGVYGSGHYLYVYMKTDTTGEYLSSDTVKITPLSTGAWWLSYVSYSVYTNQEYNDSIFYSEVSNSLNDINKTQQETNEKLDNLNENITNSDSSEASGEASDFFSSFNTDTFGLTSVITAPLELIKSVTSKTCSPLHATLPFVSTEVNLPCLSTIYESHFGSFLTIYRTITFGFVSYWVCIKIFNLVKDFKNPEHDEIEVLDL